MHASILDKARRVVEALGSHLRLRLGVKSRVTDRLHERDGRLVIPAGGAKINDIVVRTLRDATQR